MITTDADTYLSQRTQSIIDAELSTERFLAGFARMMKKARELEESGDRFYRLAYNRLDRETK